MQPTKMKTKTKLKLGVILVLVLIGGYSTYYYSVTHWIPAGYVGVIYDARSGLENKVYKPQAVSVGYFQQLYTYPTQIQNAVYTQDPEAGEVKAADAISITTSDNANTPFDVSVIYRVRPEDVFLVFKSFGPIPIADIQSQHIRRAVKEGASAIGSQYDLFALMGPKRQEASELLTKELQTRLSNKGITVERAMILTAWPSADMAAKVNSRVNSFTTLQISALNAQIAEQERQQQVAVEKAKQSAQEIAASGMVGKAATVIDLDNVDAAIRKWSGHLPPYSNEFKGTIILGNPGVAAGGNQRNR